MSAVGHVTTVDVQGVTTVDVQDPGNHLQLMLWTSQEVGALCTDHNVWVRATLADGVTEVSI